MTPSSPWIAVALMASVVFGGSARAADAVEAPPAEMLKLRDPFKKPNILIGDQTPRTELEGFSLEQMRVLGITTGPERVKAMVIAPNGRTYYVNEGMKIGTRRGVIQKITAEAIKVRERIVNVLGQEEEVDSELQLPMATQKPPGPH